MSAPAVALAAAARPTLDLAIVTCVRDYGRYLPEWAASITKLHRFPAMVGIASAEGKGDAAGVAAARQCLEAAGLRMLTTVLKGERNIGILRNAAVALSDTAFVMHLDADDTVMPHCLDDVAALMPKADVVALGYQRCGDLAAGPRQLIKLYKSSTGLEAVRNPTPCSGVSPFRRSLWERAPYPTDQVGGWDTALWRGFGHLGARFVATRRPCFWYRQHADSVFNVRRKGVNRQGVHLTWAAHLTGLQLQAKQQSEHGVSIVIPRAAVNDPERDAARAWLLRRYAALYPDWQLLEGSCAGAWSKGRAVADGLARARGRILVMADADCVLPKAALLEAVELVESGRAPWVVPHRTVHRLTGSASARVLAGDPAADLPTPARDTMCRDPYLGFAGGGLFVIPRTAYLATGGIPDLFEGWGAEDECAALIFDTMLGRYTRLPYDLVHLWHPAQGRTNRGAVRQNRRLYQRYQTCAGKPELMWTLLSGERTVATVRAGLAAPTTRYHALSRVQADEAHRREVGAMHDDFARRRLARAQQTKREGRPMAGALDIIHAQRRKEQQERNRVASEAAEQRRAAATQLAEASDVTRRKALNTHRMAQKAAAQPANKMMPAPANKTKAPPATAPVLPKPAPAPATAAKAPAVPPAPKPYDRAVLDEVPFASMAAANLAAELKLTPTAFSGQTPSSTYGFTIADVRKVGA